MSTQEECNAFLMPMGPHVAATAAHGLLQGLTFAVKDSMDIGGTITGAGNPTWQQTHEPACVHAVCVEQILAAGGTCVGKTITDELTFSLDGENHWYGTPLNPRAPDRVPGGSSSGSVAAVSCGMVDFALGTDCGGSVRVPSSNSGMYGFRPSHGAISVAGVFPFAPTFDTVGWFARDLDVLSRVGDVLLGTDSSLLGGLSEADAEAGVDIYLVTDAWAICDDSMRTCFSESSSRAMRMLAGFSGAGTGLKHVSVAELSGGTLPAMHDWNAIYCALQWAENLSCHGSWVKRHRDALGPRMQANWDSPFGQDRSTILQSIAKRQQAYQAIRSWFASRPRKSLLCVPTTWTPAPKKGSFASGENQAMGYYVHALALTAIAGVGRLPQINLPYGDIAGVPAGLGLIAARDDDGFLLRVSRAMDTLWSTSSTSTPK